MKKLISSVIFSLLLINVYAQEFKLDKKSSKVEWEGKKIIGDSHTGLVDSESGSLVFKKNKLVSGNITLDLNSLTCTDIKNEDYNTKLIGHLKSGDFFSVEKFPTANFKISHAKTKGKGNYLVKGNLTIKGITKPVEFTTIVHQTGNKATVKGLLIVDRSKFDVRYGSNSFFDDLKNKAIDDNFNINFDLVFNK